MHVQLHGFLNCRTMTMGTRGPTDHSSAVAEQFFSKKYFGSSYGGSVVTSPTSMHEDSGSIPGLAQWVKDPVLP